MVQGDRPLLLKRDLEVANPRIALVKFEDEDGEVWIHTVLVDSDGLLLHMRRRNIGSGLTGVLDLFDSTYM